MPRASPQFGWLRLWCVAIALLVTSSAFGDDPAVIAPLAGGTLVELPPQDARAAWDAVVDAVDDSYPIERNNLPDRVDGGRAGRLQTFALPMPTPPAIQAPEYRRWVGVTLQTTATTTRVEISAFVEMREALRGVDPEASAWRTVGHDVTEEQRIAAVLAGRLGGARRVFEPLPAEPFARGRLANYPRLERTVGNILSDASNFYSCRSLATMGVAFGIGAALANTDADKDIRQAYFSGIGYQSGIHGFKFFGEGLYTLPAYAVIGLVGTAFDNRPVGGVLQEYGVRGLRTALVGGPPMLLMQVVTGAGRPNEHPWGSRWVPFYDNNGVSGHAFIGAIPFVTAAKMTDRPVLKVIFYGLSVMPALSRLNDSAHYPSQIFLGYTMSVVAATAVDHTQRGETAPIIIPFAVGNTTGMGALFRF
jgi:hypothetical protein